MTSKTTTTTKRQRKAKTPTSEPTATETPATPEHPIAEPPATEPKKLSAINAAAQVLGETGQAMSCQEMIAAMAGKGYWTSPGGKTPHATLYSTILREITTKGDASRFVKAERGKFALAGQP